MLANPLRRRSAHRVHRRAFLEWRVCELVSPAACVIAAGQSFAHSTAVDRLISKGDVNMDYIKLFSPATKSVQLRRGTGSARRRW
jgi:hypothetical protein